MENWNTIITLTTANCFMASSYILETYHCTDVLFHTPQSIFHQNMCIILTTIYIFSYETKIRIFSFTFKINKLQYLYFKLTTVKFFLVKRSTEQIANYQFKFTSTSYFPLNNLTINTTQKIFETTEWTCEKQQFAKYQKNIAMKKHCSLPSK